MKKRIALLALLMLLLAQTVLAEGIVGTWKGQISASKYGFVVTRDASVVFTSAGRYALNAEGASSNGTYALEGDTITLNGTKTLNWQLSANQNVLIMRGRLDFGGYQNLNTYMRVTRVFPSVLKVNAPKVAYGSESVITVRCNTLANYVRMTDTSGKLLDESDTPVAAGGKNTFLLDTTFNAVSNRVLITPACIADGETIWGKTYKATIPVKRPATDTKITGVSADLKRVPVGQNVTLTIYANSATTRVRVRGAVVTESSEYTQVGNARVFTVPYTQLVKKKDQALFVVPGDDFGWKATGKVVRATFY